ncbi:MAG: 1-acyl-sn-glycerol-3-phosphate acyltransferase [Chitinophagales bacterium]|nr:1-acyl-sn-glycerol-3-phosphate acyltransferase [Bacteroidota bacterium]MCB9044398.1 1-acyl-sn-glycerol-3-phosphate acyltransferase [Chitinophagales bacterium]
MATSDDNLQPKFMYEPVIPDIRQWPIYELSRDNKHFIQQYVAQSKAQIIQRTKTIDALEDTIAKAVYLEDRRIKESPWKIDPPDEKAFWKQIKKNLLNYSQNKANLQAAENDIYNDLDNIVNRYAQEIVGHFEIPYYRFAAKFLPIFFNRLLNAAGQRNWQRLFGKNLLITENILLRGHLAEIRNLCTKGTVIVVPTHHSNLDSILVGWAIHCLGLPALLYGAGLNLFNSKPVAHFMNRLGAYKIDRRKKNTIYLETLKMYSRLTLQQGAHSLFFPGGTRSRSGQLETQLKLGLLGTAFDAQRLNFMNPQPHHPQKIFVVPLVISYHFVLEAATLIHQHLKSVGKEHYYIDKYYFPNISYGLKFFWKLFSQQSKVWLSFGKPMDLFGHDLDPEGNSLDAEGKIIDISRYYESKGSIVQDVQRDNEYTRLLSQHILARFYSENIVLSSHLVAFAAFEILRKKHRTLDFYGLLHLPEEDRIIPYSYFAKVIERLLAQITVLHENGKMKMSESILQSPEEVIKDGIKHVGMYHDKKVLRKTSEGDITSDDMNLLLFYHNRLEGYKLEEIV